MLVLTRKPGQRIFCYDNNGTMIKFEILPNIDKRYHNCVRIGISASDHIVIDREEIYEAKLAEAEGGNESTS